MSALMFLLIAVLLAFETGGGEGGGPWFLIATVVSATAAGIKLPDLDSRLRLGHRSALLHGVLPPFVALLDHRTWAIAAGLGFGIGFHLVADLFPGQMRGFATIKLPLWGAIGAGASYLWIIANAAGTLLGGLVVLTFIADGSVLAIALAAVSLLGVAYLLRAEGGLWALMMFAILGWLATR
ncbi:hypothetical protein [Sphingomonas echinoides]|uniref:hypothetical protein n=1 Tax=Sphingomonas echinoides TaxID=59803 RepID=UPI0024131349|nr:hypothetical protein [Sphingomonas echinoides]